MNFKYKTKSNNGYDINIDVIGFFKVDALNKEYVMYSIVDNDPNNKDGSILIGEVLRENDTIEILNIKEDEIDLVLACYNEISTQVGN